MAITTVSIETDGIEQKRDRLRALEKRVWKLDFYSDEKEVANVLKELTSERYNNGHWSPETTTLSVNYAIQLLNLKQQAKLVTEQNKGSQELVASTRLLVYSTIALAVITAIIGLAPLWTSR